MRRTVTQPAAALLGLALLPLAGCMKTRTRYTPPVAPQIAEAKKWNTTLDGGATAKPADDKTLSQWWITLGDSLLTSLEERAVKGNLDLRKAEAKIRQARAQREAARTSLKPSGSASVSAGGNRSPGRSGAGQTYSVGLDASWEPDFYGRLSGSVDAYTADVGAAQEDLRDVLVSLTAEVALNYINVRSYQSQLAVTKASLELQQKTYDLVVARRQSGLATELEVTEAAANVASTRATIPALEASLQTSINAIAVLLGERPGAVDAELAAVKPVPVIPAEVAVGVPADLVRRRPDIRGAERQVAAQTARVGVATGDLYPSFRLSGSVGLDALSLAKLFTTDTLISTVAGTLQQQVFNRRQLREKINIQNAVLDQYLAAYESTVLNALEDVENALVAFAKEQVRRKSLADATAAAERSVTLSTQMYESGLKDFLNVIDAQRSLLALQNQLAQSDATITANLVRLYKALGGGWDSAATPGAAAKPKTNS